MSLKSVVHDYEILYSTRVVQKEKRWSDGRLKFYEFNRKMEVHSEDNVLVATEFYPHESRDPVANGAFADGMTLKFPSGKLIIEINGYIGSYERDVTVKRETFVKPEVSVKQELSELLSPPDALINSPQLRAVSLYPLKLTRREMSPLASRGVNKLTPKPVGLRRVKEINKPDNRPCKLEKTCELEKTLETYELKLKHHDTRIPPGSNKLSVRLRRELGLRHSSSYTN